MNEGFLGKYVVGGERAATDDHPPVIHHLPLSKSVDSALAGGVAMKRTDDEESGVSWEPLLSTDTDAEPGAVVDAPCDATGENGETSALCVVHGCVKRRLLKTGDGKDLTATQVAQLAGNGIFAV